MTTTPVKSKRCTYASHAEIIEDDNVFLTPVKNNEQERCPHAPRKKMIKRSSISDNKKINNGLIILENLKSDLKKRNPLANDDEIIEMLKESWNNFCNNKIKKYNKKVNSFYNNSRKLLSKFLNQ